MKEPLTEEEAPPDDPSREVPLRRPLAPPEGWADALRPTASLNLRRRRRHAAVSLVAGSPSRTKFGSEGKGVNRAQKSVCMKFLNDVPMLHWHSPLHCEISQ